MKTPLRLAVPSKGMEEETLSFLSTCGLQVDRSNPRQYRARVRSLPDVEVTFQRAGDIFAKVDEGSVDLGITGYDVVAEYRREEEPVHALLPYPAPGRCPLFLALPQTGADGHGGHGPSRNP